MLGHGRRSITSVYLGNHVIMERSHRANIKSLIGKLEGNVELREFVKTEGVASVWIVGPEATGASIGSLDGDVCIVKTDQCWNLMGS